MANCCAYINTHQKHHVPRNAHQRYNGADLSLNKTVAILLRANRYCPRVSNRQASVGITAGMVSIIAGLPCCCGVSKRQLGAPRRGQKGRGGSWGQSQGRGLQIPSAEMTESERAQVHHTHWT